MTGTSLPIEIVDYKHW